MNRRGSSRSRADRPSPAGAGRRPAGVLWERLELPRYRGLEPRMLSFPRGLGTLIRPNEWGKSSVVAGLGDVLFGPLEAAAEGGVGRLTFVASDGVRYRLERDLASGAATLLRQRPGPANGAEDGAQETVRSAVADTAWTVVQREPEAAGGPASGGGVSGGGVSGGGVSDDAASRDAAPGDAGPGDAVLDDAVLDDAVLDDAGLEDAVPENTVAGEADVGGDLGGGVRGGAVRGGAVRGEPVRGEAGRGDASIRPATEASDPAGGTALARTLRELLGLGERVAFEQSFCLTQPLPPAGSLSAEVQRMLVGAGRGGVERGLARLEEEVLGRTRHGGAYGLPEGTEEGELERLQQRIAALEESLRQGRDTLHGTRGSARALSEAETRRARHREESGRLDAEAERLRAYLAQRRSLDERREALQLAEQRLARAEALNEEHARAHAGVAEAWPELEGAPEDGEARLAGLIAAERSEAQARETLQAAEDALDVARRTATQRSRELERHVARSPFEDDEGLTVDAVRELRAGAEQALTDWRAFLRREQAVADARVALRPYAMLALAPERDRALLRRYDYEAEARVRAVEGLEVAVREARAERRRLLVPDPALPNDLEAEALRAALEGPPRRARSVAAQLVVAGLVGALAFYLAGLALGAAPSVAIGLLAALAVGTLLRPSARADAQLRRFRRRSRAEREALLASYDAWRSQPVPTRRDVLRLENEMAGAREQLRSFQRRMQPYQEAYPEPGAAFDAFRDGQRTSMQHEEVHRELSSRTFGVAPSEVRGRSPLAMPAPWPRLAAFVEARGGRAQSVEELCEALARVSEEAWDEVTVAAEGRDDARRAYRAERERLRREVAVADTVLEEREASATTLRVELQAAEAARESQAEPLQALLESVGGDVHELSRRWRERDVAVQQAERAFDALASLLDASDATSLEGLRTGVEQRRAESESEARAVDALAGGSLELPEARRPADRGRLLDTLEALDERCGLERAGLRAAEAEVFERTRELAALQARPVPNLALLEEELDAVRRRRQAAVDEIEALATAHAALRAAVREFQGSYRERLEGLASTYLATLTERSGRAVRMLDDFGVRLVEPDGSEVPPGRLSQGTRDQLALALRLAIADHVADDVRLPLVLDDPFLHWDARRLALLQPALQKVARERQVVLLSHDGAFAGWGETVGVE